MTKQMRNFGDLPVRARLTLWYLLTLAAIMSLFLLFLYVQVRRTLYAQIDDSLQIATTQALATVNEDGALPAFDNVGVLDAQLVDDFIIYLLDPDGRLIEGLGDDEDYVVQPASIGYQTVAVEDERWRVRGVPLENGWLQVAQTTERADETMNNLAAQMLLGLPMALLLAGIAGYMLSVRALQPIDAMTQTARSINGGDLTDRIEYEGPADELGRLAMTFDEMLNRLQAAFERERRFSADAAHELRTPLTALKGRIDVTLSRARASGDYVETLHTLSDQIDRLISLSNDLLFMARLEQGSRRPEREPVEVAMLLAALVEQARPLANRKQIALEAQHESPITIKGNLDLLIRLFLNLLDNAIKYTPPGGHVAIRARQLPNAVEISVSDSGSGIAPEHLPKLFDRFYRVEEDRARIQPAAGGSGLGLAIAAEIAKLHGGTIQVESALEKGSTFTVNIPQIV